MAQYIDYYESAVKGTPAYLYKRADRTSEAVRVYAGDALRLTAPRVYDGEFTRIDFPRNGYWIRLSFVSSTITPHYATSVDKLSAPVLSMDRAAARLTFSGGANGDLNTFNAYRYQYREREHGSGAEWGAWSTEVSLSATAATAVKTLTVTCGNGMERQYRARCAGTAGASWYSGYTKCLTLYYREQTGSAGDVSILFPQNGASHVGRGSMLFVVHIDQSTAQVKLQYRVGSGAWNTLGTVYGTAAQTCTVRIPKQASGALTIGFRAVLSAGAGTAGNPDSVSIVQQPVVYARTFAAGSVIANRSVSHVSELNQLLQLCCAVRDAAGLEPVAFSAEVGRFANWKSNVGQLVTALREARAASGGTFSVPVPTVPADPAKSGAAAALEAVRSMVDEF